MINLYPNEKILMVVHKHWIVFFLKIFVVVAMFLVPVMILSIVYGLGGFGDGVLQFLRFFFVSYFMIMVLVAFLFWMDHYLDVWIITNERIIDVEQMGLFKRETSEFIIDRVQDITVEVPNIVATFLKYGNLQIQTAGEKSFSIKDVPNIYEIKKVIMGEVTQHHVGP